MRISDLGPVTVEVEGSSFDLGLTKQAALLSVLAARTGQRVSAAELATAAWGLDVAVSLASLDTQIWRLRNLLEPSRGRTSSVLVRDGAGYRLVVETEQVDSQRFERFSERANEHLHRDEPGPALEAIDLAMSLWRGEPFEAVVSDAGTMTILARWTELRSQLEEHRIQALLGLGQTARALADVEPLIAGNPLRERLWVHRMTALARLGRVSDALAAYRSITSLLADELGLDPGPELRALQAKVLARDPQIEREVVTSRPPRVHPEEQGYPRIHLPRRPTALIGREIDVTRVGALIARQPLVTLCGPAGCGKTRLAVEVAAGVAGQFPDGVWFVDLTAVAQPELTIDVVVSTLALGASPTVDPFQALAEFAQNRRMLLVLDNCEHVLDAVAEVVEVLLEGTDLERGPAVLTTSREPIGIEGEQLWPLSALSLLPSRDDAEPAVATASPAVRLFVEQAAGAVPHLVFDARQLAYAEQICRSLDGIPLAIELAASRVRSFSLAEIAEQARADPSRLARIGRSRGDHRQSLYEAIEWSYRLLPPQEQALHRVLSVLPGPFSVAAVRGVAAGRVASETLGEDGVVDTLLGLIHRSLVDVREPHGAVNVTTYAQLDTVRSHAHRHLEADGELDDALAGRDAWVQSLLARRPGLGRLESPAWYDEVEESYPVVRAALLRSAGPDGNPGLLGLGSGLGFFWYFRSRMIEGGRWLETALRATRVTPGTAVGQVTALELAGSYLLRFRPELARPLLASVLDELDTVAEPALVAVAEGLVCAAGGAWGCRSFGLLDQLAAALRRIADRSPDDVVVLFADVISCVATLPHRTFDATRARAAELYERSLELGNLVCAWLCCLAATVVAAETVKPVDALTWSGRAVELHERLGPGGSRAFIETVANCLAAAGDHRRAAQAYGAASAQARHSGLDWPEHPAARQLFGQTRARLPAADFDLAWRRGEESSLADIAAWTA